MQAILGKHIGVPTLTSLKCQGKVVPVCCRKVAPMKQLLRNIMNTHQMEKELWEAADQLRFPGHETVATVDGVPIGWEKKTLGEFVTLNYGKSLKETDRISGDTPVYGSSGIVGNHNKPLITGPVIIVGRKGNVGSVYYLHCPCFPIDTVYFVSSEQTSYFLYLTLQGMNFISSDAAVPGLNRNYAYSLQLIVPGSDVFSLFETKVQPIFEQINSLVILNVKLRQARDLLLPKLMSGALDVSRITLPKEVAP
jgi:type I restriction enzyme S subunit